LLPDFTALAFVGFMAFFGAVLFAFAVFLLVFAFFGFAVFVLDRNLWV